MLSLTRGLTFDDVLLVPAYNGIRSRGLVSTSVKIAGRTFAIPLASSNMDTITGVEMAKFFAAEGGLALLHRFVSVEDNVAMFKAAGSPKHVGFSIGVGDDGLTRAEALVAAGAEIVCVDVAHGHSKEVNRAIRRLRESYKQNIMIIAGNVATYAGADYLAAAGADVIKVGIGSGSVCTTRIKTGFGVPQLTAVVECSKVDRHIIADGGIRQPADAVKALAAGADMVMLGGMLSGTDETPGEFFERTSASGETQRFKRFRGMASREAQEDFMGQMQEWKTAEGVALEVRAKGPAKAIVSDLLGGIRSGMTYCGALEIRDLKRKAQFMEITGSGRVEGTPHAAERYI
ncbi:MAG: guanosine monophosphate reductase [Deltaproteobacteria bacterium]|nr:guanosine monophosphate reductase [Deltaproteobacteria bacterium]